MCHDVRVTDWTRFESLVLEGAVEPTQGWDFSWFDGRATEGRPSWRYLENLGTRMARASAVLDLQTGGGELFAQVLGRSVERPQFLAATESWLPNIEVARRNLHPFGVTVVHTPDEGAVPFEDESFELVCSRHPTVVVWKEIERLLRPGGIYFSQQIGAGTNSELANFFVAPRELPENQKMQRMISRATEVGLKVLDAREESLPVAFFDIGAVVYFLRKVIWTVPDFSVDKYHDRLMDLHERIERDGSFTSHSQRIILEVEKRIS